MNERLNELNSKMGLRTLSERVKWARINHKHGFISQSQLAEMINLSQSAIAKIELGVVRNPRVRNLELLSSALNVPYAWLSEQVG